jgi:hypothetical protein
LDSAIKDILLNVKIMVAAGLLVPEYEVMPDSYVCFVSYVSASSFMYYAGKLGTFPEDVQTSLLGAYLNESIANYKVVGIYEIMERK